MANNTSQSVDIQKYLDSVDYPADKQTLIQQAKSKNAPGEVMSALNGLPNREYSSAGDVSEELGM